MPVALMVHETDPADLICDLAGELDEIEVFNSNVLVGVYVRPEKTKSGIILTHKTTDEDRYQSKVGLILKMGPRAFDDPTGKWFVNQDMTIGDWVVYRPSDGMSMIAVSRDKKTGEKRELLCRIISDLSVKMRINGQVDGGMGPDRVY